MRKSAETRQITRRNAQNLSVYGMMRLSQ